MNTLAYSAEIAYRQSAFQGDAEVARRARRSHRPMGAFGARHRTSQRASLASPPGLTAHLA